MLNTPDKAPDQFAPRNWKFSALGIGNTLPNLRKIFAAFGNGLPRLLDGAQQANKKIGIKLIKLKLKCYLFEMFSSLEPLGEFEE